MILANRQHAFIQEFSKIALNFIQLSFDSLQLINT